MQTKEMIKSVIGTVAPDVLHRRFIRLNTAKEPEIALLPLMVEKNQTALDIGANQGLYVHHLLALTPQVVAFEPLSAMQRTLRRAYGERIRLEPVALSEAAGVAELRFPDGHYPLATLAPSNDLIGASTGKMRAQTTELRTLDSYDFKSVGLVKIDVEGHEEAVLRGGRETLRNNHPSLIIEIEERHNSGSVGRVDRFLQALDYVGMFLADGALHEIAEFDLARDQSPSNVGDFGKTGHYVNNFLFVPRPRCEAFKAAAAKLLAKPQLERLAS